MGLSSMTGFGRGVVTRNGYAVTVEISSVNRKQFDLRFNAPRALAVLEPQVSKQVRGRVSRGGVTVAVLLDRAAGGAASQPVLDMECAQAYVVAARRLAKQFNLADSLRASELLRLPGVMQVTGGADPDGSLLWPLLRDALKEGLAGLQTMREAEGQAMASDMGKRLATMRRLKDKIKERSPQVVRHYRTALQKRLAALPDLKPDAALRESVAREVAMFADRCAITEELVRLDSHIAQSMVQLASKGPAGRTLEFLCQEMLREINTIGAKANDARIATWVVELKSLLEALREQVQNVE